MIASWLLALALVGAPARAIAPADDVVALSLLEEVASVEVADLARLSELRAALAACAHDELVAAARAILAEPRHAGQRAVALDALRPAASEADVALAFDLVALGAPPESIEDEVAAAFVAFIGSVHARERAASGAIVSRATGHGFVVQGLVIEGLAQFRHARTAEAFERLMAHSSELRTALLVPLARLWTQLPGPPPKSLRAAVRAAADHSVDQVRREAALALGWLADDSAVAVLVPLLEDESPAVAGAAHWSLKRISNLPLRANAHVWWAWLAESERWWSERADECSRMLRKGQPADVLAALQEIGRQRLHRERTARELEIALAMDEPEVVMTACAIATQLGVASTAPALAQVLLRGDAVSREAAHRALVALTGAELPAEFGAWRDWLRAR